MEVAWRWCGGGVEVVWRWCGGGVLVFWCFGVLAASEKAMCAKSNPDVGFESFAPWHQQDWALLIVSLVDCQLVDCFIG